MTDEDATKDCTCQRLRRRLEDDLVKEATIQNFGNARAIADKLVTAAVCESLAKQLRATARNLTREARELAGRKGRKR